MNFTPHPTYEGLLRQARAMERIIKSMEATRSHLSDTNDQLVRQFLLIGSDEVEAERSTNQILTNENEKLRAKVNKLETELDLICAEGLTPADAKKLHESNQSLRAENNELSAALQVLSVGVREQILRNAELEARIKGSKKLFRLMPIRTDSKQAAFNMYPEDWVTHEDFSIDKNAQLRIAAEKVFNHVFVTLNSPAVAHAVAKAFLRRSAKYGTDDNDINAANMSTALFAAIIAIRGDV